MWNNIVSTKAGWYLQQALSSVLSVPDIFRKLKSKSSQMQRYQGKNNTSQLLLNQFSVVHIICRIVTQRNT